MLPAEVSDTEHNDGQTHVVTFVQTGGESGGREGEMKREGRG